MPPSNSRDREQLSLFQEQPLSNQRSAIYGSPPRLLSKDQEGGKERRNPSITPRKFNRFFTPRSHGSTQLSSARQALQDITGRSRNSTPVSLSRPIPRNTSGQENGLPTFTRDLKRRKLYHTPDSSPEDPNDTKYKDLGYMFQDPTIETDGNIQSSPCERILQNLNSVGEEDEPQEPARPIKQIADQGLAAQVLQINIGSSTTSRQYHNYPVNDWQDETASFYTKPADVHMTTSIEGPHRVIPFCATSCNTNSLTAVGDEEGRVRLLESKQDGKPAFKDVFLAFRVHTNAIIDMVFSDDDSLLATASGDQTARVVDMATQTTLSVLGNHHASLKQVRFQPGANNTSVLATSSRDGSVQIWDLRCKGDDGPQQQFHSAHVYPETRSNVREPKWARPINSIYDAHRCSSLTRMPQSTQRNDLPARGESAGRAGDMSVTAITFLAQENLLVTSSEGDASVKLWDLRCLHTKRKTQIALSQTRQPQSHSQWRHFGTSSLNISSDGSRLYTLCKDNTVYAYSTAHLILGYAPELSSKDTGRKLPPKDTKEGLGPIFGYRHPQLHATSFYVKSAIRKAKNGRSELLAVGSSDGCAILFPTDERYFPEQQPSPTDQSSISLFGPTIPRRPGLRRMGSGIGRVEESIPISTNGTPLIRGHDREVGSLTWTADGELVTVGDDFLVRCWREGNDARDLRMGGEAEGRRWGSGWADVSEKYDEDDD